MNKPGVKRALVTGATGYVGSSVTKRLVADGWNTHIITRQASSCRLIVNFLDRITVHPHDGSTESMLRIVDSSKPDVVFHLASLFLASHQPKDIEPLVKSNVLFAAELLEAMAVHGISRLVNTGTVWQHYQNKEYCPVNLYAATKQAFEAIISYYTNAMSLQAITLTLFDTYGPSDPRPKLFTSLSAAGKEQKLLAMSPGEQAIDLVYIDDVVDAFMVAAGRLLKNEVDEHERYMVATGTPVKLRDLVDLYIRVTGKRLQVQWGGRAYRPREVMIPWGKGIRLPGWAPTVDLETGIRIMEGLE